MPAAETMMAVSGCGWVGSGSSGTLLSSVLTVCRHHAPRNGLVVSAQV